MAAPTQNPNNTPVLLTAQEQAEKDQTPNPFSAEGWAAQSGAYQLNPSNPDYVSQTAVDIRQTGEAAAQNINQQAAASAGYGLHGAQNLQGLGTQAMGDIAGYGVKQGGNLQNLGQQAAGAITGAAQGGAGELYDYASAARAQQAAAMGRAAPGVNFGAQNASLGGVAGLGGQLAGLEAQQGPSAAQAQLQSGLNQAQQSNLALARSGRGWGGSASALSQAAFQNAMAGQQAANQSAMLRAGEDAAWRQRQAQNLGAAGQLGLNVAGQQGQQAQFGGEFAQQQMALNDQAALAYGQQQLAANQAAGQMGLEGATQAGQLAANTFGQGATLGLQGMETGYGMNIGAQQAAGQLALQGAGQAGQLYGAGAQTNLGAIGMENQLYGQQADRERALVQDWLTQYGISEGVGIQQQQLDNQLLGGAVSAGAALLPYLAMASDRDAKQGIKPAETIEIAPIAGSGPSGAREMPMGGGGMMGPGGPAYDAAMKKRAAAEKIYGRADAPMIELNKPGDVAMGMGAGLGAFGKSMMRPTGVNPYLFNPAAQQYLASDKRSKTRIAELEGQVAAYKDQLGIKPGQMELGFDQNAGIYRSIGAATPTVDPMGVERMARLGLDPEGNPLPPGFSEIGTASAPGTINPERRKFMTADEIAAVERAMASYQPGQADPTTPFAQASDAREAAFRRRNEAVMGPTPPRGAADAIAEIPAYSFDYKEPERFGQGRQTGIMAQDALKQPETAHTVKRAPDGTLLIDAGKMTMVNTAAISQMQNEIKNLKGQQGIPSDEEVRQRVVRAGDRIVGAPEIFNRYQRDPDVAALDQAYAQEQAYRGLF